MSAMSPKFNEIYGNSRNLLVNLVTGWRTNGVFYFCQGPTRMFWLNVFADLIAANDEADMRSYQIHSNSLFHVLPCPHFTIFLRFVGGVGTHLQKSQHLHAWKWRLSGLGSKGPSRLLIFWSWFALDVLGRLLCRQSTLYLNSNPNWTK